MLTHVQIAEMIDHALLKPEMNREEVAEGCTLAVKYGAASVCVRGCDVAFAYGILKGTQVPVGTVVGFPHGSSSTEAKLRETETAIAHGASEIDAVIPIGLVKSGNYDYVYNELEMITKLIKCEKKLVKIIFENCYLTGREIVKCCEICNDLRVDFIKTSTGFGTYGARAEDIKLMRKHAVESVRIKASGGIRTLEDFLANYDAGADRQGTSSTKAIIEEAIKRRM